MPAVVCRNCGAPNFFMGGRIPSKVKCQSCGNTFNTGGVTSPMPFDSMPRGRPASKGCAVTGAILIWLGIAAAVYFIFFH